MFSVLLVLLIIVAVFMIAIILLQKSEGSGMSGSAAASMFGGALTGSAAGNFLTRTTAWLAVIFFVLCALLALVSSKTANNPGTSDLRQELVADTENIAVEQTPVSSETSEPTNTDKVTVSDK
ncbi:MAG: preprotein translocase subunit SecG [Proteobacteria bacterium]|nr:preprotein translocase subunit SecG [Candidatus Enterousia onthequi]MCQ2581242.1 preprotein translocase subunit SecG [Alphaproteobacteria bacterium]